MRLRLQPKLQRTQPVAGSRWPVAGSNSNYTTIAVGDTALDREFISLFVVATGYRLPAAVDTAIDRRNNIARSASVSDSATFFRSRRPVTLFASGPLLRYQL